MRLVCVVHSLNPTWRQFCSLPSHPYYEALLAGGTTASGVPYDDVWMMPLHEGASPLAECARTAVCV